MDEYQVLVQTTEGTCGTTGTWEYCEKWAEAMRSDPTYIGYSILNYETGEILARGN